MDQSAVPTEITIALIGIIGTLIVTVGNLLVARTTSRNAKAVRATLDTNNHGSHVKDTLDELKAGNDAIRDDVVRMRIGQAVLGEQIARNAGDVERLRGSIARIHERIDAAE